MNLSLEAWVNVSKNAHNRMVQFVSGMTSSEPTPETLGM